MQMISRRKVGAAFIGTSFLVLFILIYLAINPGSATIDAQEHEATVHFTIDQQIVVGPGTCVVEHWQVENIREVYLDGIGTTGIGDGHICLERGSVPTLRVVFQDQTDHLYKLQAVILATEPIAWVALIGALTFLFVGSYLVIVPAGKTTESRLSIRLIKNVAGSGVLLLCGIAFSLLLLETGLRMHFMNSGTDKEHLLYIENQEELERDLLLTSDQIPIPYLNYGPNPLYQGHNKLGYRGPEIELPKPEGVFRILVYGGSATYGIGMDWDEAYPAQLETILREQYGYRQVEVVNAAMIGYSSWETLVNFAFRGLELEPNLIIVYDNPNDVTARAGSRDCYSGMNPMRGLDPIRKIWYPSYPIPSISTLYRYAAYNLGWDTDPLRRLNNYLADDLCNTEDSASQIERVETNPPTYFERNLRNIIAMAQVNGVKVMLSSTAYYQATPEDVMPEWWRKGVDENNIVVNQIAQEMNVPVYDLLSSFPPNEALWLPDGVHPSVAGMHEQAAQYAAYLVESGMLARPNTAQNTYTHLS